MPEIQSFFSATASFRRDFGHIARPILRRLIISYGDIWKGQFTKTNHEPYHRRLESKHHRRNLGSDIGRTGKGFPKIWRAGFNPVWTQMVASFQHMLWCRHISHATNVLLFKFHRNIFIGVRIIKEIPDSVPSGTPCIIILVTNFMQGIYNYIPETNRVSRIYRVIKKSLCTFWLFCNHQVHREFLITLYSVAALLYLQSVQHLMLFCPRNMFCAFT